MCANRRRLVLFNPSTRAHRELPPFHSSSELDRICFFAGIGYDSSTGHYKVLHATCTVHGFLHGRSFSYSNSPLSVCHRPFCDALKLCCNVEVHILTLNNYSSSSSSSRWRKFRGIDNVVYVQRQSCVYSNGSLHWLICKKTDADDDHQGRRRLSRYHNSILSFDLAEETFREMAVPEDVVNCSLFANGLPNERERLGSLGDCLALSYCFPVDDLGLASSSGVIWIMKEYNRVRPSWTQLTAFPLEKVCPRPTRILQCVPSIVIPLCFLEEKEEAHVALLIQDMADGGSELVSLSLIDHSLKELVVLKNVTASAAIYVDTLVSPMLPCLL